MTGPPSRDGGAPETREAVERAVAALGAGGFVLVVDDERRENEGDLILAAESATVAQLAFMIRHTSGLICVPMTGERIDALALPLMVGRNTEAHRTAFTVSVDLLEGTTTGISAADRTATIRALADRSSEAGEFARPGHVFPLRYTPGGVLVRPGHTEATVDLLRLAGLSEVGVLCELVNDDGTMMRGSQLDDFAAGPWHPDAVDRRRSSSTVAGRSRWSSPRARPGSPRSTATSGPSGSVRPWTGPSTSPS